MAGFLPEDSLSRIVSSTHSSLNLYESLLGLPREDFPDSTHFWDVIVLTTADERQKHAFEAQIEVKRRRGEIPLVDVQIIADPPGPKIGNGGSTLWVLKRLAESSEKQLLDEQRILIIHAGGQSKRLITCSALGKIFAPLPTTLSSLGVPFQATTFDVLLALSIPLIPRVPVGGWFILCADTVLPLYLEKSSCCESFLNADNAVGFFALAHPSSVQVGKGHGVYCLSDEAMSEAVLKSAHVVECRRVLQKPSTETMYDNSAVLSRKFAENGSPTFSVAIDGADDGADHFVYTDSVFWFDAEMREILLALYEDLAPLTVEIDAYGDFLQAMGTERSGEYSRNHSNITFRGDVGPGTTSLSERITETRSLIYKKLKSCSLSLLVANESLFIHVGTVKEYLHFYTQDDTFRRLIARRGNIGGRERVGRLIFSRLYTGPERGGGGGGEEKNKKAKKCLGIRGSDTTSSLYIQGCVMSSVLEESSTVPASSVVEFCVISGNLKIGSNSLFSHCKIDATLLAEGRTLPEDLIVHTIAVHLGGRDFVPNDGRLKEEIHGSRDEGADIAEEAGEIFNVHNLKPLLGKSVIDPKVAYVTIAYNVSDDMKRTAPCLEDLQFFGRQIVWSHSSEESSHHQPDRHDYSLWSCPIFAAKPTMERAFAQTMHMIFNSIDNPLHVVEASDKYFSAERAVNSRHVEAMLNFRSEIAEDIIMKVGSLSTLQ